MDAVRIIKEFSDAIKVIDAKIALVTVKCDDGSVWELDSDSWTRLPEDSQ
jgi:hypothetical protein